MFTHFLGGQDPDVSAHLARMTSKDRDLHADLEALILGLKYDGLWDKIEILCVTSILEADSLLNLKGSKSGTDSINSSGVSFTSDAGFDFIATPGQTITLNYAETDCSILGQYDSHQLVYIGDHDGDDQYILSNNINYTAIRDISTGWNVKTQQGTISVSSAAAGLVLGTCTAINSRQARVNDTVGASATSTAHTLQANDFGISSGSSSTNRLSAWGIGAGLTLTEHGNYEDRIRTYAQARGFDVF